MTEIRHEIGFDALKIKGGILPLDYLRKIVSYEAKFQEEKEYQIPRGLKIRDEIGRYWRIALGHWQSYRERPTLNESTKVLWQEKLLKEVLCFQDLTKTKSKRIGERIFPLSHFASDTKIPLLLTNPDFELDKSYENFGDERGKRSPHWLIQEYLNAQSGHAWGIVSNGLTIRLVRKNPSLSRPAYIEVDLERVFEEELYKDFASFWLLFHSSRFEISAQKEDQCILEIWRTDANEVGERALEKLRNGVTQAARYLGSGFLEDESNKSLREKLSSGELSEEGYFNQLLRLIYRMIFLLTMEERDLLHERTVTDEIKTLYQENYGILQLRERSLKKRNYNRYPDLWTGLNLVFDSLGKGESELGLPALGGIFDGEQCKDLTDLQLTNKSLLSAIRSLSFFDTGQALSRINYRDMDTEELGSVYESLLELVPEIKSTSQPWKFVFVGDDKEFQAGLGSARKLTGSYYTPDELVQELIKSTLEPVIKERLQEKPENPSEAILSIKVIDPACGSGHFLLSAARRLADQLSRIEAGAEQPGEKEFQHAMRQVIGHCVFGVDLNPMAVELCRIALWLESVEPGKPLTFLDTHILCGNSLVGVFNPEIIANGIPNDAYKPLLGDDKDNTAELKKINRKHSKLDQSTIFSQIGDRRYLNKVADFESLPEDRIDHITEKKRKWSSLNQTEEFKKKKLRADFYTSAFFAIKSPDTLSVVPTNEGLNQLYSNGHLKKYQNELCNKLASEHKFFHWHLAFPQVFEQGGFDVILGNPPWEVTQLSEIEFFSSRSPEIAAMEGERRKEAINMLKTENSILWQEYESELRNISATSNYLRKSGNYPLASFGKINLYAYFAELFLKLSSKGRAGIVIASGIATDDSTKKLFAEMISSNRIVSLFDFENREGIFKGVHRSYKFCLLTFGQKCDDADFSFYSTKLIHLDDNIRHFKLTKEEFDLINPNTKTCPIFRSKNDAELTKTIYKRTGVFWNESSAEKGNPWGITFKQGLFNMTSDSGSFKSYSELEAEDAVFDGMNWTVPSGDIFVPLYEGKLIHQYDHRWAKYDQNGESVRALTAEEKNNPELYPLPRYWISKKRVDNKIAEKDWKKKWLIGWRDIARATDERTIIACIVPAVGVGHTLPLIFSNQSMVRIFCLLANLNSLILDYIARLKVGGIHLTYSLLKQFPVLKPEVYTAEVTKFIVPRVISLISTERSLECTSEEILGKKTIFSWDIQRRKMIKAELDAFYANLYELSRDDLAYILDPSDIYGEDFPSVTFPGLKRNDIEKYGDFRTKELVLNYFDELNKAKSKNMPYISDLEPFPKFDFTIRS
jgi:type I restriction-modification system DNA methylase subunit